MYTMDCDYIYPINDSSTPTPVDLHHLLSSSLSYFLLKKYYSFRLTLESCVEFPKINHQAHWDCSEFIYLGRTDILTILSLLCWQHDTVLYLKTFFFYVL